MTDPARPPSGAPETGAPEGTSPTEEFDEASRNIVPDPEAEPSTVGKGHNQKRRVARAAYVTEGHIDRTRRQLAWGLLVLLSGLYLAVFAGVLTNRLTTDFTKELLLALAGPQALVAAVVGFYYGDRDRRN